MYTWRTDNVTSIQQTVTVPIHEYIKDVLCAGQLKINLLTLLRGQVWQAKANAECSEKVYKKFYGRTAQQLSSV